MQVTPRFISVFYIYCVVQFIDGGNYLRIGFVQVVEENMASIDNVC